MIGIPPRFSAFADRYIRSWWIPPLISLLSIAILVALGTLAPWLPFAAGAILLGAVAIALICHLVAAIACAWKRNGKLAIGHFLTLFVCAVTLVIGIGMMMVSAMLGPSDDHFADSLKIPSGIVISEPLPEFPEEPGDSDDRFQMALLNAMRTPGSAEASISANLGSLVSLNATNPDLLQFYLAASPAWRVFEEHGTRCATRRWKIGSQWSFSLHGYYTRHDLGMGSDSTAEDFQSRVTLGLGGNPWWEGNSSSTRLSIGETAEATLATDNNQPTSHTIINAGDLIVEIFEQSAARERRVTKATIAYLEAEFLNILTHPSSDYVRTLLPAGSIRSDTPSIALRKSFQPGLYEVPPENWTRFSVF